MTKTQELFPGPFDRLPPIFQDCVDEEVGVSRGLSVAFPQPVGDHVVATDGRIMVRVVATPAILETIVDIAPKKFPTKAVENFFGPRSLHETVPTPLPSLDHLERCRECEGVGHRPERRCTGVCDFDDLSPCRGKGTIPAGECYECDGTGIDNLFRHSLELRSDVKLAARYIHLLIKHGATLYLPVEPNTWETTTPVYFTVAGDIEGVLMPMAVDKPEKAAVTEGATS